MEDVDKERAAAGKELDRAMDEERAFQKAYFPVTVKPGSGNPIKPTVTTEEVLNKAQDIKDRVKFARARYNLAIGRGA